jgi:DNA repair exonuclease SbcCD nuclease subunit|tara:strand:+ start:1402 stop:2370 length:969 start_codon:yes stop_codon:yes gene_type:complete
MKILVTSDWHIHTYKDFPNREENIFSAVEDMFSYCNDNNITAIYFGGDLVHANNNTPIKVTLNVLDLFERMFDEYPQINVFAISGNHGLGEKSILERANNLISWVQILSKRFSNFNCIDMGSWYTSDTQDTVVYGIPYLEFKEDFDKALTIQSDKAAKSIGKFKTLLIHQTPDFPTINFPMDTNPNDPRYKVFDHVHCGHIHKRMPITEYFSLIGTPTQLGFDEGGLQVDNGFLVYDTETKKNTFHKLDYPKFVEVKEGEPHPPNCYVRELPNYVPTVTTASREEFTEGNSKDAILVSYCKAQGIEDQATIDVGLKILSKIN